MANLIAASFSNCPVLDRHYPERQPLVLAWPKFPQSFLPAVLGLEIVLISLAYVALASPLSHQTRALCDLHGLGAGSAKWRLAGSRRHYRPLHLSHRDDHHPAHYRSPKNMDKTARGESHLKVSLLSGIWVAFVAGATREPHWCCVLTPWGYLVLSWRCRPTYLSICHNQATLEKLKRPHPSHGK